MSTRSTARNLFPPLEEPERTIRRRTRVDPNLLNNFEEVNMASNRNDVEGPPPPAGGDLQVPDLRTMEELHRDTINAAAGGTFMKRRPEECYDLIENMTAHHNDWDTLAQSDISYDGPLIPSPFSSLPKVVEQEPEVTKDMVKPSTEDIQPSMKLREKDNQLVLKVLEIFRKLHFHLSFADALLHMPKFAAMFKSLLDNKEKLLDLATTSVNENCSTIILKKLPEKLGDTGKFLIPCDFPELVECLASADLGASINLMPLSIWENLSLIKLTPTQMILELADRSTTRPAGIAEDVFVKVGKFHFPTDFIVVDYVVDPRVPLILGRPFLRIGRALIDVYGDELTLQVDYEAITFKVGQTSKYSYNDTASINRIDVIGVAYFILEEIKTCLASESISPRIDNTKFDLEGDILLIEKLLNDDPSSPLPLKELNLKELKSVKSSIDEPPELELKDLPSHLEHVPEMHDGHFPRHDRGNNRDTNLVLNWEKCHFMVKEGIVLGHRISKSGIKVDKAKVVVIAKLPHPTTVKGIRSFLGHAGFYRRFIRDFSKISRPMTRLLEKETMFFFSEECIESFNTLKKKLTEAPILVALIGTCPSKLCVMLATLQLGQSWGNIRPSASNLYTMRVMLKYGVTHRLSTVYHPQTSGQVEVSNHGLKRILERTVGENRDLWSDKLDDALWPPVPHSRHPSEKTKKIHDSKIKNRVFNVGDRVILFNSRLKIFSGLPRILKTLMLMVFPSFTEASHPQLHYGNPIS
nr:reverse transcriptase domain-containing protein [Tanacetum cinerariifolium]